MRHADRRPGLGRAFVAAALVLIGVALMARLGKEPYSAPDTPVAQETYRLVHAIGNDETITATNLTKRKCEEMKREKITIAEALGTHSERLGVGSITCLPESTFDD